jgi:hypothetical protein
MKEGEEAVVKKEEEQEQHASVQKIEFIRYCGWLHEIERNDRVRQPLRTKTVTIGFLIVKAMSKIEHTIENEA